MRIRTGVEANAPLESVAITDIVLNMFIFFFTAFSLVSTFHPVREGRVAVVLPQAASRRIEPRREPLVVTVDGGSRLFFGAGAVTRAELAAALAAALAREPARPVLVRADRSVPLQTVVAVLELARDAGAAEAGIAIRERPSAAAGPGPAPD